MPLIALIACNERRETNDQIINSMTEYWGAFQKKHSGYDDVKQPQSFYYCDNKKDADECAELVVKKIKQATSPSVWWFKKNSEAFPQVGDLAIVTNWDGAPKAVIKTTKVEIVKFKDITSEYAFTEGEGDKTLAYWKKAHWDYYTNEMKKFDEYPTEEMEIVCEYFETIW